MRSPLKQLRKDVSQAIDGMTDYPIGVMISAVFRQRSDYTHFLRLQHQTKFIEIGLMPHDIALPSHDFIERHVSPNVAKLVAAIDPRAA